MSKILLSSILFSISCRSIFGCNNIANNSFCSTSTSNNRANMSSEYSIGYVTICDAEKAKELATKLVNENKVACVNIIPSVTSIYRWENKLETDSESLMILKTRTDVLDDVIEFIKKNHPYTVPEIIFTPIIKGNPDYLNWISSSVPVKASEKSNN